jgi:uncharacterized damage-inducible protein DinB
MLLPLIDHALWADAQARASIATLDASTPEHARATRLYAHLAAAEHVWLARLEDRAPAHAVWAELSLDAAGALAAESLAGLRAIAADGATDLQRVIEYRTSAGQTMRNTVADVLAHVALHGSHHRGQIALLTRQGGGTPAATDYIVFVRGVPAPAQPPADATASSRVGAG